MSESANDRVGELVDGRYRLLALVGRGGMADVYRARDEVLGRTVAVKMMRAEAGVEFDDALRRHEMEAKIGAGVSHPGVVMVFDVQPSGDDPHLVMEFVPGKTLSRVLVDGPLEPRVVADLGAQLADALAAIHEAGVVHRDIKPSNAMLVEQGDGSYQVKLTDFGVSRYLEGTRLTSPDLLVGTARYLSPEQAVLDEVGPRADIYALGLVLLEALTGEEAFPGSRVETLSARLHRPPRIPADLGTGWALALGAMTRREPDERPDAAGAAAALRAV
ncbi:serine/threonine-protein kinase, partial [Mumia xiangluensis]